MLSSLSTIWRKRAWLLVTPLFLNACGGSSGDNNVTGPSAPTGFTVDYDTKGYLFHWNATQSATRYELYEDPDGAGPQPEMQIGGTLASTDYAHSLATQLLPDRVNASYRLRACDASGCGAFTAALIPDLTKAIGYFKASSGGPRDKFGQSVVLSSDGSTLAVGAPYINSNSGHDSSDRGGAVYVFVRSGGAWSQQGYLKMGNTPRWNGKFGTSLALTADGSTLAVGAPGEASNARGIDGNENTQSPEAGAVYLFNRSGGVWSQQAYVKASNTPPQVMLNAGLYLVTGRLVQAPVNFGQSVALSADGRLLAVGAPGEASGATGIEGNQGDSSAKNAGAVYVFAHNNNAWSQQSYIKASNTEAMDYFGTSVALSADGGTLAVGAPNEASNATGINGDQADNSGMGAGAVYVFTHGNGNWSQQAYIKSDIAAVSLLGSSVALSSDGNTLAVSAIDVNIGNHAITDAAYVFTRSGGAWSQQAHITAYTSGYLVRPNYGSIEGHPASLALAADGSTLVLGVPAERSSATGISGNQADLTATDAGYAGAVFTFRRSGAAWNQDAYMKASNTDQYDFFGSSVALSADGHTLAVGAVGEDSKATGINGDQADNTGASISPYNSGYGAVYLY